MKHLIRLLGAACALLIAVQSQAGTVYVVGHRNPDTDSVAAAVAAAHLLNKWKGLDAVAAVQGRPSREAALALATFHVPVPERLPDAAGKTVVLVDHSDKELAPEHIGQATIMGIFDHHKLGGLTTSEPPEVWIRPVGSTCTVVKALYDYARITVPAEIAGVMLCAILSDTISFRSPTTTPEDRRAAGDLAQLAGVADVAALGEALLREKSSFQGLSASDLLQTDFKDFLLAGKKIGVGQLEMAGLATVEPIIPELVQACRERKAGGYHSVLLLLTDVGRSGSLVLIASDDAGLAGRAFGVEAVRDKAWVDGLVSRKKQVVPMLEKALSAAP